LVWISEQRATFALYDINPLNAELNPICHLLALLGVHHFLHISRIRVKSLTDWFCITTVDSVYCAVFTESFYQTETFTFKKLNFPAPYVCTAFQVLDYMPKISINWPAAVTFSTVNKKSGMAGRTHLYFPITVFSFTLTILLLQGCVGTKEPHFTCDIQPEMWCNFLCEFHVLVQSECVTC